MANSTFEGSASLSSDDSLRLAIAARQEIARRNPNSLLDWALAYRMIAGRPMQLTPAIQGLYRDDYPFIVVQKAAQVFISEYLINGALFVADRKKGSNGTAIFVMPTQSQVEDFSQSRVDRAIGESNYLRSRVAPPTSRTRSTGAQGPEESG